MWKESLIFSLWKFPFRAVRTAREHRNVIIAVRSLHLSICFPFSSPPPLSLSFAVFRNSLLGKKFFTSYGFWLIKFALHTFCVGRQFSLGFFFWHGKWLKPYTRIVSWLRALVRCLAYFHSLWLIRPDIWLIHALFGQLSMLQEEAILSIEILEIETNSKATWIKQPNNRRLQNLICHSFLWLASLSIVISWHLIRAKFNL